MVVRRRKVEENTIANPITPITGQAWRKGPEQAIETRETRGIRDEKIKEGIAEGWSSCKERRVCGQDSRISSVDALQIHQLLRASIFRSKL